MSLSAAILNNDYQRVESLLALGADPNTADQRGGTPLHYTASYGREVIVPLLLAAGANPNVANMNGWTPLHVAASYGREEIVQLLLDAGADPTMTTKLRETPSRLAREPRLRALLDNAEYVWTHSWTLDEHARWPKSQRLERVGAASVFRTVTGRTVKIPQLPPELLNLTFEHM